jgi:HlyD family secretion protein
MSRHASIRALLGATALAITLGACSRSDDIIKATGTIELDEVDVSSLVGGRIVRLYVDEGDSVRAGDTLAVLDRGEVVAAVDAQSAEAQRAVAQLQDVQSGPRTQEIDAARAALAVASADSEAAETEYRRTAELFARDVVSAADRDRARTARDAAVAKRDQAREQLRLLEAGARRSQIAAAARGADAARAQLAASRSRARELVLTAPSAGVVLLRNFRAGEIANAGQPVVTLGDPDRLWMRVYVSAPQLARLKLGQSVEVTVRGLPQKFRGRIVEIATEAEFTPRAALTEEERANLVFGVKVRLDPSGGTLKAGLPADVHIPGTAS